MTEDLGSDRICMLKSVVMSRHSGSRHDFAVIGDSVPFIHPTYETRLSPRSIAHENTLTVADV